MSETMKAITIVELGKRAELCDRPMPKPGPEDIIVKTWFSGVSVGTEMWIATGARNDYGPIPFINGYQASGEVVEIGDNVTNFAVGDIVTTFCVGSHAQYVKGSIAHAHKLPTPSLAQHAAMFVQPSVAGNALSYSNVNTGDNVLITGQGLIGQTTAILARLRGAYVVVSDISAERLVISEAHCADWVIDAGKTKVSQEVLKRFPNGMDIVLESTGFQALVDDAMICCKRNGSFVFEGFYPGNITYNFTLPHFRELRGFYPVGFGSYVNREAIIRLMASGMLDISPLISHTPSWKEVEPLYNTLFTPERDRYNGIIIDWRD